MVYGVFQGLYNDGKALEIGEVLHKISWELHYSKYVYQVINCLVNLGQALQESVGRWDGFFVKRAFIR